jgi:hypothetical protein
MLKDKMMFNENEITQILDQNESGYRYKVGAAVKRA